MLRFRTSKGIIHMLALKESLLITLVTWPRAYLQITTSSATRPKLFYPEGFSPLTTPLPPKDKKGKLQWDKREHVNFCQITKDYFGDKYGENFDIDVDWVKRAVRDNRDLCVELSVEGRLKEAGYT